MPSIASCEPRSPAEESPPRKKFKYSLKLKQKVKQKDPEPSREDDNGYKTSVESNDLDLNCQNETVEVSTQPVNIEMESVDVPLPYTGLANLGNTCYLNAVLQVLRYCPEFCQSLANLDELYTEKRLGDRLVEEDASGNQAPSNIIHSIHELMCEMENAEESYLKNGLETRQVKNRAGYTTLAVQPNCFLREFSDLCPMFGGYQQHDAQEFLRSILSLVEDGTTGLAKENNSAEKSSKENISTTNETKVRGGCKYPNGVVTKTAAESTEMTFTADKKAEEICAEGTNDTKSQLIPTLNKTLASKLSENKPTCTNIVQRLFEGKLQLQTRCLNCEVIRKRSESFQDISVPIQNTKPAPNTQAAETDNGAPELSDTEDESDSGDHDLLWAISKFAALERLQGDNKYFCDSCRTFTEAEISTYFDELPEVLTIHLKRFQTSYGSSVYSSNMVTKVTRSLQTPQHLSLKRWCSSQSATNHNNASYQLFGVVMHSGMSSCSGHYLSYVNTNVVNTDRATIVNTDRATIVNTDRATIVNTDRATIVNTDRATIVNTDRATVVNTDRATQLGSSINKSSDNVEGDMLDDLCAFVDESFKDSENHGSQEVAGECCITEEPKQPVPTRDIRWYFTPMPKKAPRTSPQGSNGSTTAVNNTTPSNESGCPVQSTTGEPEQEPTIMDDDVTNIECTPETTSSRRSNWLKFDDAEVHEITENDMNDILSQSSSCYSTPYLLFYFKV